MEYADRHHHQGTSKEADHFHSEADFKHALAWEIHLHDASEAVRLEVPNKNLAGVEHIDILVRSGGTTWAIELKYKKKKFDGVVNGEEFHLRQQNATDTAQYEFVKDISRLERFVKADPSAVGYAMFLTNEPYYWKYPRRPNPETNDAKFRIYEGCVLTGVLGWSDKAAEGTKGKNASPLALIGSYTIRWADYAEVEGKLCKFRYVLLQVSYDSHYLTSFSGSSIRAEVNGVAAGFAPGL